MGLIRQYLVQGDVDGCRNHIQALWAGRHAGQTFTASDADDAAWVLDRTQAIPALQRQLWPKLLGLLTRWAFLTGRAAPSGPSGPAAAGSVPFLQELQRWLAARLASGAMPWAVRAPSLLMVAVIGSSVPAGGASAQPPSPSPLQLSYQALRTELQRSPSADLVLDSSSAVADVCTAVELVLERLAIEGDWQGFLSLLSTLLAALGCSLSDLCSRVAAVAMTRPAPPPPPPPPLQASEDRTRLMTAVAVMQEAAAAALATLHASCRQLGAACARAAAAASNAGARSPAAAAATTAASSAARMAPGEVAAQWAALETLAAIADHVYATAAAAAAAAAGGPGRGWVRTSGGRGAAAPQAPPTTDPWVTLSIATAAAGGLLEGCTLTVQLQPLGRQQELLLRLLQPTIDLLSGVLREASASAAAAATAVVAARPAAGDVAAAASAQAGSTPGGCGASACSFDADPRVAVLSMAVGYCWSRLRAQAPLQDPLRPALRAAEQMVAAAATGLTGVGCWLPCRGALAALLLGSLGVGRVLQLAIEGGSPGTAAELLEDHTRGPLFADTQVLAKAVVEALRAPAPEQALEAPSASLASAVLSDVAAAVKRLHLVYGAVADAAAGRAWLAALPPSASGSLRELLDRAFVCVVSVLAAAYDSLAAAPLTPGRAPEGAAAAAAAAAEHGRGVGGAARGAEARAPAAAAALGALADLQFCALQLRAHGDLVARLSADTMTAPAAALPPLLALLPCYPAFAVSYAGGGFSAAPVAASRLAFLLPLASSCVPHASDVGAAASAVLPYTYLFLKGAPESVVQAAHSIWAALLAGLCGKKAAEAGAGGFGADGGGAGGGSRSGGGRAQRGGGGACLDAAGGEEARRDSCLAEAASMVPYYIERTCQEPCSVSDMELLEWGVRQVLTSLPESHPMKVWCTARLVRQLRDFAALCEEGDARGAMSLPDLTASPQRRGGGGAGGTAQGEAAAAAGGALPGHAGAAGDVVRVRRCAAVVGAAVMGLDFPLLPAALEALDAGLRGMRAKSVAPVLQQLHDLWLSCNDYARKQLLEHWLQRALVGSHVKARL